MTAPWTLRAELGGQSVVAPRCPVGEQRLDAQRPRRRGAGERRLGPDGGTSARNGRTRWADSRSLPNNAIAKLESMGDMTHASAVPPKASQTMAPTATVPHATRKQRTSRPIQ
jgi:hypothetical protein